jgi:hypothetical protein
VAGDRKNSETNEPNEAAPDADRDTAQEVPIGIPVSEEEFASLKEQATKPASCDECAAAHDEGESDRDEEAGDG